MKCCINKQFNFTQMKNQNENEEEMEEREWVIRDRQQILFMTWGPEKIILR